MILRYGYVMLPNWKQIWFGSVGCAKLDAGWGAHLMQLKTHWNNLDIYADSEDDAASSPEDEVQDEQDDPDELTATNLHTVHRAI